MQSGNKESFLNLSQKLIAILILILVIFSVITFKSLVFQPNFLIKKFGELSIDPEIAFTNKKPTFLEFYAEWCEVCKDMAPKIADIKESVKYSFVNIRC